MREDILLKNRVNFSETFPLVFLVGSYASIAFLWTIRDLGYEQGVTSNIHPNRGKPHHFRRACRI